MPASGVRALAAVFVHVARLAADVGFVHFDVAAQFAAAVVLVFLHGETNALEHEPCGLLRDADSASDFVRADAVLRVGDHPHARQPLIQAERGVLENRAGLEGELSLRVTGLALPSVAGLVEIDRLRPALGALDPVRPAPGNHVFPAVYGD